MNNFEAAAYAVTAGVTLVIVLYLAYIIIPIVLVGGVITLVYFVNKSRTPTTSTSSSKKSTTVDIRW